MTLFCSFVTYDVNSHSESAGLGRDQVGHT